MQSVFYSCPRLSFVELEMGAHEDTFPALPAPLFVLQAPAAISANTGNPGLNSRYEDTQAVMECAKWTFH